MKARSSVPKASDVEQLLTTQKIPEELDNALGGEGNNGKALLVCMMGNTSLRVAEGLAEKGIAVKA